MIALYPPSPLQILVCLFHSIFVPPPNVWCLQADDQVDDSDVVTLDFQVQPPSTITPYKIRIKDGAAVWLRGHVGKWVRPMPLPCVVRA